MVLNIELPGASGGESDEDGTQEYLQAEALRILDEFGNHPSFCMLTMGNEVLCDERDEQAQARLMRRVARCREHDSRRWPLRSLDPALRLRAEGVCSAPPDP